MKTPEKVREYEAQKRAKYDEESNETKARIEQERKTYLVHLEEELDRLVDKGIVESDITSQRGVIDITSLIISCEKKGFQNFVGFQNSELIRDSIQYFKENKWSAEYSSENTVYYGSEPSTTVYGHFLN